MDLRADRAFEVAAVSVDDHDAARLLWRYFHELSSRYNGRPSLPSDVEAALAEEPSDDLTPPTGLFLMARYRGQPAGCVGLRVLAPQTVEVTRMFIHPDFRNLGLGGRMLSVLETHARELGATTMRLATRDDLIEARNLYAKHGYAETPAYSDEDPYVDHWFEKRLPG